MKETTDFSPQCIDDVIRTSHECSKEHDSLRSRGGGGGSRMVAECMQDSVMTAPTETGSISEDEGFSGGWFGGITSDFRTLAATLKETAGGVANFVQRSAMAVASEIAHLEEEELAHRMERLYEHQYDENITLRLPWEVPVVNSSSSSSSNNNNSTPLSSPSSHDAYQEDEALRSKIFALSTRESTFLQPYSAKDVEGNGQHGPPFCLDEPRVHLVRRILSVDDKLAAMHARLSGRSNVKEAVFWQNYFYNCELTREEYFAPPVPLPSPHEQPQQQQQPQRMIGTMESFEECSEQGGYTEESYVEVPPSPSASQRSIGSMVVVDACFELP